MSFLLCLNPIFRKRSPVYSWRSARASPGEALFLPFSFFYQFISYQKFIDSGSDLKKQQQFENVTHPPLITSSLEKLVIESLNVPELHLLLGKKINPKTVLITHLIFRSYRKIVERI